jgi:hypothetical protein
MASTPYLRQNSSATSWPGSSKNVLHVPIYITQLLRVRVRVRVRVRFRVKVKVSNS